VESGKFEFYPEPVQLPRLVSEVMGVLQGAAQRKHILTDVDLDPGLNDLVLDPVRLKQVLYNYLSNAIKFTPEQGRVSVRARPDGASHFRLEVEDTGIGIAAADLGRLFGEFQQLDSGYSKRHQGTGLGLALIRRLVEAQGGSVGVRSVPGQGSVFHLVLRRLQLPGVATADAARPRLLVIEGDAAYQSRLAQALVEAGFAVDGAATGAQALRQTQGQSYGALALDLVLPDQGGLDLLAHIRREGSSRGSPVLGVSMPAEPGSAATFAVADVLFKPINTTEVAAALARLRLSRNLRVLVVDDDPLARQLMQATLAGMGTTAVCVEGGRQALEEVARQPPDAMILDLIMPEMDGFETLDSLRRLPEGAQLPVYIWTSMILSGPEIERLSRSVRAILGKGGGDLEPLLASLRRWRPAELPAAEP
jgi:CheY-like chemotaxis protein